MTVETKHFNCDECAEATPEMFRVEHDGSVYCAWCHFYIVDEGDIRHTCLTCGGLRHPEHGCPCKSKADHNDEWHEAEMCVELEDQGLDQNDPDFDLVVNMLGTGFFDDVEDVLAAIKRKREKEAASA